jgi:adenine deaminase
MNRKLSLLFVSLLFVYGCHQDKAKEYPEYKISNIGIAFKNVNIVPMTADKIVKAQTVLVKNSKIVALGSVNDVKIPENAMVIDCTGSYLMPGLKDDFGIIDIGKRADLILLKKNPLENVENIRNPLGVMASGRWYDQKTLQKMLSPGIPTIGEIRYVNRSDTGQKTQIEILVGKDFSGRLPNNNTNIIMGGR